VVCTILNSAPSGHHADSAGGNAGCPALREHRLYQAAHLLTDYGFEASEVEYEAGGNLPLGLDPKAAWALAHPERFPLEVGTASYQELVRVPGIGPTTARRIVETRGTTVFRGVKDLQKIGMITDRAADSLLSAAAGWQPNAGPSNSASGRRKTKWAHIT
jgi:predicted DNA-binding helix-hairpin-helix protein